MCEARGSNSIERQSMISYEQALDKILSLEFSLGKETVPLLSARGRVLAADIVAPWPLPRFDHATMDGFAVRAEDLRTASVDVPAVLPIKGESAAGHPFAGEAAPGTAIRISTGAPVPAGCDAVVPVERVHVVMDSIATTLPVQVGASILRRGTNITQGTTFLARGAMLHSMQIAALASFNLPEVDVFRRPRVAILTSGDEVKPLGSNLGDADVVDSSTPYLSLELEACGCETRSFGISPDDAQAYRQRYEEALAWGDIVVTTAGVSVGPHDIVAGVLDSLGAQLVFTKVAIRPGKPMMVARVGGKVHFGLPGNPLSVLCNTEIFVKPFLRNAFGMKPQMLPTQKLRVTRSFQPDRQRLFFINSATSVVNGECVVAPLQNQNSANSVNGGLANALIVAPPGDGKVEEGTIVNVLPIGQGL
ncbi:molybdopterin molybdotransferase MoeA [Candidatus Sumerlaeota bacterium]|nr:molybdopterin molybdotransferase MoeA [Candidatus Sumerlaeota bacterium]